MARLEELGSVETAKLAKRIRIHALEMISRSGASHIGGNLSAADILAVLFGGTLQLDPSDPRWVDRDRFILSKGHACAVYYAVLAEVGFFPREWLDSFYTNDGKLWGHATHKNIPGVEASTGSLGHGLPMAVGMALAAKIDRQDHRVVCLMSDGECDEGTTWEAALFSAHHGLGNLVVVVDYNKGQALGQVKDVLNLEPLLDKWRSFGWKSVEVDGHDISTLRAEISKESPPNRTPICIIAHTIKGKGVSFMEGELLWHYRCPKGLEFEAARRELESK